MNPTMNCEMCKNQGSQWQVSLITETGKRVFLCTHHALKKVWDRCRGDHKKIVETFGVDYVD